ncbi:MAG: hypothetical protein LLG42_05085 [Chloroflexi bacterium]|nr:hypothetical protein [Chloroflexota bacterium]
MNSFANSSRSSADPIPMDILQIALRRWWVIVLGMCLGGMLGMGLHLLIPPVYQTRAVISAGVDFARTGKLTDVEEDYIIKKVGDLIGSDAVIEETIELAAAQGINLDRRTFDEMHFLQRSFNDWLLVVRAEDPQQATVLANLWADAAWSALSEASLHLIKLDSYEKYLDSQITCRDLQLTTGLRSICFLASVADINSQIDETVSIMQTERLAARGLVSGTVINLTEYATVPAAPKILGRNTLTLAGALLGGLLACLFLFVRK